jgi:hypothetical protein
MVSGYVFFCLILSGTFIAIALVLTIMVICSYACSSATRFKLAAGFSSGGEKK